MSDKDNSYLYIPELHGYDDSIDNGSFPVVPLEDLLPSGLPDDYFYKNLFEELDY